MTKKRKRILAVASGGGHWVQLARLRPAFAGHDVAYVTVSPAYREDVAPQRCYVVNDATRWNKFGLIRMAAKMAWIVLRERPDVIISTGAAPGYFALRLAGIVRARTVWIDSAANVERVSMAGQLARKYADLWLTQWPHLSATEGPHFLGGVL